MINSIRRSSQKSECYHRLFRIPTPSPNNEPNRLYRHSLAPYETVRDKRRSLWEAHAWRLHHINAPDHTALSIGQFFAERNIATLEYPQYFLDMAPCDFFLFSKIKSVLKRTHFSDIDSIKLAATTELKKIPENVSQECIESWKKRMHKCFKVEENCFEGI